MQDHADDCQVVHSGVCTCTRGIGQPAAQINRKRLVEEYQRGHSEGWEKGYQAGVEAAIEKLNHTAHVDTLVTNHHRHRAGSTVGIPTYEVAWTTYLWAILAALGVFLAVGASVWFFGNHHWPLWAVGSGTATFMAMVIAAHYEARKRYDVHRTH